MTSSGPVGPSVRDVAPARLDEALSQHQAGQLSTARKLYESILEADSTCSQAWHLLGLLEHQSASSEKALEYIGRAIAIDPQQAVYFNNYGAVLLAGEHVIEALAFFHRAISIRADYADAHANLGRVQQSLRQMDAAIASYQLAVELSPKNCEFRCLLASLLLDAGRSEEAIDAFEEAIIVAPNYAGFRAGLGSAYLNDHQADRAADCFQKAGNLAPGEADIWFNLGVAQADQELVMEAAAAFDQAMRLQPQRREWQVSAALLCPPVFPSAKSLASYGDQLRERLNSFQGKLGSVTGEQLFAAGIRPPLTWSFQGCESRALKEALAELVRPAIKPPPSRQPAPKPRVGFVVTRGHAALFLRCNGGLLERMQNSDFDIYILCSTACTGVLREGIKRSEFSFVEFPDSFNSAVQAIAAARCDVLYHWEIGTDSLNYLLPFARLAPVQCTSWGTQVTAGIAEVDYYLSSKLVESASADRYCTETLVRLPELPTFQRQVPRISPAQRADFGLAEDAHVYLCPQNLLKLHPDQDELFDAILDRDPLGVIVLKEGRYAAPGTELRERFRNSLGANSRRVKFIPWQLLVQYYRLLTVADVILDPIHYSAGSSAYDLFSLDLPVVTLPGELNVSRYTHACYRKMELTELVANNRSEYIELAIRVGMDRVYRDYLRTEIRNRKECLFETAASVEVVNDWLQWAIAQSRS